MTMNRFFMPLLTIVGLAVSASVGHAQSFEQRTSTHVSLDKNGGVLTTVAQVSVPAGTWVAFAKSSAVNWEESDYVRCGIYINGNPGDSSTTMIGEGDGKPAVATLSNVYRFKSSRPVTLSLVCTHDAYANNIYIDPGAVLAVMLGN